MPTLHKLVVPRICAIVITYKPDIDRLATVLCALTAQVEKVLVVDNGSRDEIDRIRALATMKVVELLPLDKNVGIGGALNVGIRAAMNQHFDFCLLMDQDSIITPSMVNTLADEYLSLVEDNHRVAAIGPRFLDSASGAMSSHVRFAHWHVGRVKCSLGCPAVDVDYLITSGSLIPVSVLQEVGLMDEGLFIDHVDTEWILRARAKGYRAFGDCTAVMEHSLGEYRRRAWFLRWREIPIHRPFRYYYIFRNSLLLYRRDYMPWAWRRVDVVRLMQILTFMLAFHPNRLRAIRMMWRGLRDGLKGITGQQR